MCALRLMIIHIMGAFLSVWNTIHKIYSNIQNWNYNSMMLHHSLLVGSFSSPLTAYKDGSPSSGNQKMATGHVGGEGHPSWGRVTLPYFYRWSLTCIICGLKSLKVLKIFFIKLIAKLSQGLQSVVDKLWITLERFWRR